MGKVWILGVKKGNGKFEALVKGVSLYHASWIVRGEGMFLLVSVRMGNYEEMWKALGELADPGYVAYSGTERAQYRG